MSSTTEEGWERTCSLASSGYSLQIFKPNKFSMSSFTNWMMVLAVLLLAVKARVVLSSPSVEYSAISCRGHTASIEKLGGVGDGVTLNTMAFHQVVNHLSQFASDLGAEMFVPPAKWLTGSFKLTSHFTLYLHRDDVLIALQDINLWVVVDPLPSYGHGRDAARGGTSAS